MKHGQQRDTARDVRQHGLSMAMDHAVDVGKHFVHLAVDETLRVSFLSVWFNRQRIGNLVLDEILGACHERRSHVPAHEVRVWRAGAADGDVAVGIDHTLLVENMVCCDEFVSDL